MPSPTGYSSSSTVSTNTGTLTLDALLGGTKWGGSVGTGVTLTYSFIGVGSYYEVGYGHGEFASASGMTAAQMDRVRGTLEFMSRYANVKFNETTETSTSVGDLRFGRTNEASNVYAHAYQPGKSTEAGDVWISNNNSYFNHPPGLVGGDTNSVYYHEILHALGLKHPFEGPKVLPYELNNQTHTIMSYNGGFQINGMQLLDIEAIQHLYGKSKYNSGNTTYTPDSLLQAFWGGNYNIWDAGGIDTVVGVRYADLMTGVLGVGGNQAFNVMKGVVIENLTAAKEGVSMTGNNADNVLRGAYVGEIYTGQTYDYYASTIRGMGGNDTIIMEVMPFAPKQLTIGQSGNAAYGDDGDDKIFGSLHAEYIYGGAGDDRLSGGYGGDYLNGGSGFDYAVYEDAYFPGMVLIVDLLNPADNTGQAAGDTYVGIEGIIGSASTGPGGTDYLRGDNKSNKIFALSGDDFLDGRGGNDYLDGGTGADFMTGGIGNDTYVVDSLGDYINEAAAEGTDKVLARSSFTLQSGASIETLAAYSATGTTALTLKGNSLSQTIIGNAGANVIEGGKGARDTMQGLGGNDTYIVRNATDVIIEGAGQGTADAVRTAVSYTLGSAVQVEKLATTSSGGTTAINLTGNNYAQSITGNAGGNVLTGLGGKDKLYGLGGNDTFKFSAGHSAVGSNRDIIQDFEDRGDNDTIDLSGFSGTLAYRGTGAFTAANQVRAIQSGDHVLVQVNTGGSLSPDAEILLLDTRLAQVTKSDFLL